MTGNLRYGYYDDDGEWISEPYVGFGGTLVETITENEDEDEDDWSLTDVRLHILDTVVPIMIPQGFDSKQVVDFAKALEDYVYSS